MIAQVDRDDAAVDQPGDPQNGESDAQSQNLLMRHAHISRQCEHTAEVNDRGSDVRPQAGRLHRARLEHVTDERDDDEGESRQSGGRAADVQRFAAEIFSPSSITEFLISIPVPGSG